MTATDVIAPWQPHPWQHEPFKDKSKILLLTGSAGGGKSRLAAEKIHAYMQHYPGATGLLLRKAREFANKSMVMMMHLAIGNDPRVTFRKSDKTFAYNNGSMLFVGGMKDDSQREAIRSIGQNGAVDIVWMEEATAFVWQDFQELQARMRGTAAPWRQIILTTNPDGPNHWIHQQLMLGQRASTYFSSAKDNPANPSDYVDDLNTLTGTQYERLVLGKWVQAEGVVYDNFSVEHNVTTEAEHDPAQVTYWGVDNGYAHGQGPGTAGYHPLVILVAQHLSDGSVNVIDEYYATQRQPDACVKDVLAKWGKPRFAVVDSSAAALRGLLAQMGVRNSGGTHKVGNGIQVVRRFIRDGNGRVMLRIHPRCKNLITEMQSYKYDDRGTADDTGEVRPDKMDDHGPDALRYLLYTWR